MVKMSSLIHPRRSLADYLFFSAFGLLVSLTFIANIESATVVVPALSCFALYVLLIATLLRIREYRGVEVVMLCMFGIIAVFRFLRCDDTSTLKLVLLLAACKGVNLNSSIRFDMTLRIAWTIILIAFSQMGLAEDIVTSDATRGTRHSLGFSNANQLGMDVLIISLEMLYLYRFKLKITRGLLLLGIVLLLDYYTGSRSATILIYLAVAFALLNTFWDRGIADSKVLFRACQLTAPILFVLTWMALIGFQQGEAWALELNEMLTNRVRYIDVYSMLYSPSFFGRDLSEAGITLDTLYAYLVYGYGILITAGYLVAFPALMQKMHERGENSLVIVFLLLSIYGLSERLWVCAEYNALMLAFSVLLYDDGSTIIQNEQTPSYSQGS
ncbi:hypothetical protein [Collinsella ihumii]|uniref:hypothetical protein n=1 Tax=Collinsella ihumii TaxID=1720204 RepID=UPI000834B7F7|nr:hypothetical protein [Collinsella ihumii]